MRALTAALALVVVCATPGVAEAATPGTPGVGPARPDTVLDTATLDLLAFKAAPVGIRLAALGHEPLAVARVGGDEYAVVVYAPFQGALSRWDDESRVVLYRRGAADWDRLQFVSKASESIPGRIADLKVRDVDGDGVMDLVAFGRPHGPVGRATSMIFRRRGPGEKFDVVFRRRQITAALTFGPGLRLVYTYETPAPERARRFEAFDFQGGMYVATDGRASPIVLN